MVKITCIKDLENISDSAAKHIAKNELDRLFTLYEIDDISCSGLIIVIEDSLQFEQFAAMGLTEPINGNFEFVDYIKVKQCNQEDVYLFGCIIICDVFAVDIVVNSKILTNEQISRFKSNLVNREYELEITED